jgi:hypothetical protein
MAQLAASPTSKPPDTRRQQPSTARPTSVERHRAADFSLGRRATSGVEATAFPHATRYSEHTHRATERHGRSTPAGAPGALRSGRAARRARDGADRQRLPCLVSTQAAACGSPALLELIPEQCTPPGLACRLSARRRVPLYHTRGRRRFSSDSSCLKYDLILKISPYRG